MNFKTYTGTLSIKNAKRIEASEGAGTKFPDHLDES